MARLEGISIVVVATALDPPTAHSALGVLTAEPLARAFDALLVHAEHFHIAIERGRAGVTERWRSEEAFEATAVVAIDDDGAVGEATAGCWCAFVVILGL